MVWAPADRFVVDVGRNNAITWNEHVAVVVGNIYGTTSRGKTLELTTEGASCVVIGKQNRISEDACGVRADQRVLSRVIVTPICHI